MFLNFLYFISSKLYIDNVRMRKFNKLMYVFLNFLSNLIYLPYLIIVSKNSNIIGIDDRKTINGREVIVSLTSFPARINSVWICIETLMRQNLKPSRIILWLANEQFSGREELPISLLRLEKRGLEIKFCDDLRPHKKYYYTMKENPEDIVITVDDDVFYPNYTIQRLIETYEQNNECISCNRGCIINTDNESILSYNQWKHGPIYSTEPSFTIMPTGVGGVLYPPHSLNNNVFNKDDILTLCLNADDLWLKTMSLYNYTKVVKTKNFPHTLFTILDSQKTSLVMANVSEGENDKQFENILDKYPIKVSMLDETAYFRRE